MSKTVIKVLEVKPSGKLFVNVFYIDTVNGSTSEVLLRVSDLKTQVIKGKYYNATLYVNLYTSMVESIDSEVTPEFEVKLLTDILADIESKLKGYEFNCSPNRHRRELRRKRDRLIERIKTIGV